jgi:hypothetical protein
MVRTLTQQHYENWVGYTQTCKAQLFPKVVVAT